LFFSKAADTEEHNQTCPDIAVDVVMWEALFGSVFSTAFASPESLKSWKLPKQGCFFKQKSTKSYTLY
jgi:hypothetical protein